MKTVTEAVLKAGLIDENTLAEMKRMSPVIDRDAVTEAPKDLETAGNFIADALESDGYVRVRETDLEAVRQYIDTAKRGILHLAAQVTQENDEPVLTETDIEVTYGTTPLGDYIIAWQADSIAAMMTNGLTHMRIDGRSVYFKDARDLFFGKQKAFMVCVVSSVELGS